MDDVSSSPTVSTINNFDIIMSKEDKVTETVLISSYQHISNGGTSIDLIRRTVEWKFLEEERKSVTYFLRTGLSSYGVKTETTMPLFETSIPILEEILKVLKEENIQDPDYLSSVRAQIIAEDSTVLLDYELGGSGESQQVQSNSTSPE
jgi:hypothetical protein